MITGATTIWAWSEEYAPEDERICVAICDDDGEPIDDALVWYFWDASGVYDFCEHKAKIHDLEFIDDLAPEHRAEALATTNLRS